MQNMKFSVVRISEMTLLFRFVFKSEPEILEFAIYLRHIPTINEQKS